MYCLNSILLLKGKARIEAIDEEEKLELQKKEAKKVPASIITGFLGYEGKYQPFLSLSTDFEGVK